MMQDVHRALLERDAEFREDFGFGVPLALPQYRSAVSGPWELRPYRGGVTEAYVAQTCIQPPHHVLRRDGVTWMSDSLLEIESHAWHLHRSRGTVVVAGLGMGMFAYAAAAKPEVDLVVVGELDSDVIEVVRQSVVATPEIAEKIVIVQGDVLSPGFAAAVSAATGGRRPDYLYADIWPSYPHPDAHEQTGLMCGALAPVEAGWWGQELAFAHFAEEAGLALDERVHAAFFASADIPAVCDDGFLAFCGAVMRAHCPDKADDLYENGSVPSFAA